MSLNDLRWVRVRVEPSRSASLREYSLRSVESVAAATQEVHIDLPDLSEYATPLAKARILLDSAAEIEHALMVQYLYALFSLRSDSELTAEQRRAITSWRTPIRTTAVEEMGHLMTVQNLLLCLRQPVNFEREDFPPRKHIYPFPMQLEPLSQKSLAKYVIAESPPSAANVDDILSLAVGSAGGMINRVGVLYAVLGVIFTKQGELESNANNGKEYSQSVLDISRELFRQFPELPPEEWHLLDEQFDAASSAVQAPASWGYDTCKVYAVKNRGQCLEALEFISVQGEGLSDKNEDSHFERFLKIYRGADAIMPFPAEGDWNPAVSVPTDPFVVDAQDPQANQPGAISEPTAAKWAQLANLRYALLLGWLQQYFQPDMSAYRDAIQGWCFGGAMTPFVSLNRTLASLPRRNNAMVKAAFPFNLPEVVNLPAEAASRLALLKRRHARSWELMQAIGNESVFDDIRSADQTLLDALGISLGNPPAPQPATGGSSSASDNTSTTGTSTTGTSTTGAGSTDTGSTDTGSTPPPAKPTKSAKDVAKRQMVELLKSKRGIAQFRHNRISTPSGTSLSNLFKTEQYDSILDFLQSAPAVVDPFATKPLIVPGRPLESAYYLQITDPDGAMAGIFSPDEQAVVEQWINSLATPEAAAVVKPQPFQMVAKPIADGLDSPIAIVAAPGQTNRLYIAQQTGAIRILDTNGSGLIGTPFLELNDISTGGERGLLGLAFHPDFASNHTFFINCTNPAGTTEIRSYQTLNGSVTQADPASKKVLLTVPQPFRNHNGGWIAFGPRDGYLYIALGDGGSANDPQKNAQNLGSLLGKLLRIDVNADAFPDDSTRNYAIPPTNPFVNTTGARPEIWAYGLRNPWRCSFDRLTGDLHIGDVGQNKLEELNFQPATSLGGENYGWSIKEGTQLTGLGDPTGLSLVDPIHEYGHTDGFSIIGGFVYRGQAFPVMRGTYFFGDHIGRVWSLTKGSPLQVDERTDQLGGTAALEGLTSFGEDHDGELFLATLSGTILQLTAEAKVVEASLWSETAKIRIHPSIGVARVGNAGFVSGHPTTPAPAEDYFVGPERPYESSPPPGGYKRAGLVRRQAARFRVYAYDAADKLIGEITSDIADINWTAELANKKASFRQFDGPSETTPLRNSDVTGADRAKLEIKPGPKTLTGPNRSAAFDGGSFTAWQGGTPRTVNNIYLGEMQTDDQGRLLMLGGDGTAHSPWNQPIREFANNDGWYDTISDGPVRAQVTFRATGTTIEASPAWVLVAPPKFAPALRNVITMYDTLFQVAVDKGWLSIPDQPSFRFDIQPILARAMSAKWLLAAAGSNHDPLADAAPPTPAFEPADVFARLRNPNGGNGPRMNMPQLFDDHNQWVRSGNKGLAITRSMYEMMRRWSIGQFNNDWTGTAAQPPEDITPAGLDQAALENCAGAAFYPGIEASWMLRDKLNYLEPFRLDPTGLNAGDISRQMAVPWQADFYDCTSTLSDGRQVGWWPQQRPDSVFVEGNAGRQSWIRQKVTNHEDMVDHWHELAFIVDNGTRFVETERS